MQHAIKITLAVLFIAAPALLAGEPAADVEFWKGRAESLRLALIEARAQIEVLEAETAQLKREIDALKAPKPAATQPSYPIITLPDVDPMWWTDIDAFLLQWATRKALSGIRPDIASQDWWERHGQFVGQPVMWTFDAESALVTPAVAARRYTEAMEELAHGRGNRDFRTRTPEKKAELEALVAFWRASLSRPVRSYARRLGTITITAYVDGDAPARRPARIAGKIARCGNDIIVFGDVVD